MNCIVTAGPTYEPLDEVRRLTNFSTGRLGTELANFLADKGHNVTLLVSQQATWCGDRRAHKVETFTTRANLCGWLRPLAGASVDAVFHAAAVSDFAFKRIIWRGVFEPVEAKSGKISTDQGPLLAELVPTPKVIGELRGWFPKARLIGWKYELDGDRASVLRLAEAQIKRWHTDACVANGRAYGEGYGLVTSAGDHTHLRDAAVLYEALERFIRT